MISYPQNVEKIMNIFAKHGYPAYAVGGCVRDSLMGKSPNDWDMTTSCRPDKMLEIFASEGIRTLPTGLKHGTVSLLIDGETYECTTFRIDGEYSDSRHPNSVIFTENLKDDLSRRDFTINAMASANGLVCDFFGGQSDLENKIIRCVGEPHLRFSEDALRILRAVRFATVLGFEIDSETLCAAKHLSHTLSNISSERKTVEFSKILCSDNAKYGIKLLFETDVVKQLIPDADMPSTPENFVTSPIFPIRLAELLWAIGARDISHLRLSNKERDLVHLALLKNEFSADAEGARRTLSRYGENARDICIIQGRTDICPLLNMPEVYSSPLKISELAVGGLDIVSLGFPKQKTSEILCFLLEKALADPSLNSKNTLISIAKRHFGA